MRAAEDSPWAKLVLALVAVVALALLALCCLPPWWGRWAGLAQAYTRIPFAFGYPPKHFNGVWREYYDEGGRIEYTYRNGKREGLVRYYLAEKLFMTGEYRGDIPWSGMCNWRNEDHPWYLAEYRNGKIWMGAGYIEGKKVSPDGYKEFVRKRAEEHERSARP